MPNTCATLSWRTCVFPFIYNATLYNAVEVALYNGTTHYKCSFSDSPTLW